MPTTDECWTCRFFRDESGYSPEEARRFHENGQSVNGTCRRNAPVAVMPDEDDRVVNYGHWPAVLSDDWCGEHETPISQNEGSSCSAIKSKQGELS